MVVSWVLFAVIVTDPVVVGAVHNPAELMLPLLAVHVTPVL